MAKKRGRGRPKKPPTERAAERIEVRLLTADKEAWEAAAARAHKPLSAWIRDRLNTAANRERKEKPEHG